MIVRGSILITCIVGVVLLAGGCAQDKSKLIPGWAQRLKPKDAGKSDSLRSLLALARLSAKRGEKVRAVEIYEKVIEKWPETAAPHHRLAVMRAKEGKFDEAEEYFSRAMELDASDCELLGDYGYFCYIQNDPRRAEDLLRRALKLEPNNARSCNNLAIVLGEQGRDNEALAFFRRAGDGAQAQANMAFIYVQRGELRQAIRSYSMALNKDEDLRPAAEALVQLASYMPEQVPPSGRRLGPVGKQFARGPVRQLPSREFPQTKALPRAERSVRFEEPQAAAGRQCSYEEAMPRQQSPPAQAFASPSPNADQCVRFPNTVTQGQSNPWPQVARPRLPSGPAPSNAWPSTPSFQIPATQQTSWTTTGNPYQPPLQSRGTGVYGGNRQ